MYGRNEQPRQRVLGTDLQNYPSPPRREQVAPASQAEIVPCLATKRPVCSRIAVLVGAFSQYCTPPVHLQPSTPPTGPLIQSNVRPRPYPNAPRPRNLMEIDEQEPDDDSCNM